MRSSMFASLRSSIIPVDALPASAFLMPAFTMRLFSPVRETTSATVPMAAYTLVTAWNFSLAPSLSHGHVLTIEFANMYMSPAPQ